MYQSPNTPTVIQESLLGDDQSQEANSGKMVLISTIKTVGSLLDFALNMQQKDTPKAVDVVPPGGCERGARKMNLVCFYMHLTLNYYAILHYRENLRSFSRLKIQMETMARIKRGWFRLWYVYFSFSIYFIQLGLLLNATECHEMLQNSMMVCYSLVLNAIESHGMLQNAMKCYS
jgi:hypothetical protein